MESFIGSLLHTLFLSLLMGFTCSAFFETILPKQRTAGHAARVFLRSGKPPASLRRLLLPASFALGFFVIAYTPIPPYLLQPVRSILVLFLVVQIFFDVRPFENLILSILFCGLIWITGMLAAFAVHLLPLDGTHFGREEEVISSLLLLCLVLIFHKCFRGKIHSGWTMGWVKYAWFPVLSLLILLYITMFPLNLPSNQPYFLTAVFFSALDVFAMFLLGSLFYRETELSQMKLRQERTDSQIKLYANMQQNFQQQRRFLHDYKNQLNCIQGLLADGHPADALAYLEQLTGSIAKNMDFVDTNHPVVNVILNQKYKTARENGITMTLAINDLSGLTVPEADLIVLLVNLIDNAIEACEQLKSGRIIQFKMVQEDSQLILSVRNPLPHPIRTEGNVICTTKSQKGEHGIGLLNVDTVIQKLGGTSAINYGDGWFRFSAVIPLPGPM